MTVVALNRRAPAAPEPESKLGSAFIPQPAARHAMHALEGSFNALKRAMSGPSTPEALRGEIQRLARLVQAEAANVGRFTR